RRIERARLVLDRPCHAYDETSVVGARLVGDHDDDLPAVRRELTGDNLLVPGVEVERIRNTVAEPDIGELGEPGKFAHVRRIGSLTIVDRLGRRRADDGLAEARHRDAVDLAAE